MKALSEAGSARLLQGRSSYEINSILLRLKGYPIEDAKSHGELRIETEFKDFKSCSVWGNKSCIFAECFSFEITFDI